MGLRFEIRRGEIALVLFDRKHCSMCCLYAATHGIGLMSISITQPLHVRGLYWRAPVNGRYRFVRPALFRHRAEKHPDIVRRAIRPVPHPSQTGGSGYVH